MITYEDECCGRATPAYPCMGSACHYRNVKHLYCDICEDDVEKLYKYDGQELCDECLLSKFEVVEYE